MYYFYKVIYVTRVKPCGLSYNDPMCNNIIVHIWIPIMDIKAMNQLVNNYESK
jgi:hypothetical protein